MLRDQKAFILFFYLYIKDSLTQGSDSDSVSILQTVLFCPSDSVHNVAVSLWDKLSVGLEFRLYELETHSDTKLFCFVTQTLCTMLP